MRTLIFPLFRKTFSHFPGQPDEDDKTDVHSRDVMSLFSVLA